MADKRYALDMNYDEWKEYVEKGLQEPKFRTDQITQWVWQKHTDDPEDMTNLSKDLRTKLAEKADFAYPQIVREQRSSDGTRKFLMQMRDGNSVEAVLMKFSDRLTACISTQVGCPLQCTFCATGLSGFVRNLTAGEIAGQMLAIEKKIDREVNNVVYMGMGEPFMNTENVLKSIRMLNDPKLRNLGIRHITVSTSGVIPGIKALADSGLGVRLAVSLHAADDELRSYLMPVNHSYPVDQLRKALQDYQEKTGDRVSIEYTLFGGLNDSVDHARALVRYLKGLHSFVNLIPYNSVDGRYDKPKSENVLKFRTVLQTAGFETEIRSELGADIDAACGQLRRKTIDGEAAPLEAPAYSITKADMAPERPRAPQAAKQARPRPKSAPRSYEEGAAAKRYPSRASGGFVEERGKRRKTEMSSQERYRSGKMKEARPVYRGRNSDDGEAAFEQHGRRDERPPVRGEERFRDGGERPRRSFGGAKPYGRRTDAGGTERRDDRPQDRRFAKESGDRRPEGRSFNKSDSGTYQRDRGFNKGDGGSSPRDRGFGKSDGGTYQRDRGFNKGDGGSAPRDRGFSKDNGGPKREGRPQGGKTHKSGTPSAKQGAFSKYYGSEKRGKRGK